MRLQTLEIKGFKSFADDTVMNFAEDVIGVVGPNGSGKSNIVDAIRWVLGEQSSKELRLDQMSSVIFNGTKKRKPGGMARVTLTFENTKNLLPTEYQTVAISRMLYRSGESEYRLNGVTCRLKDITNLLMDTGIGSNSYAIIALGMVDEILADKDNARRKMFEQAAGISKYKVRKKETISKLKSTSADLERVDDLLFEINSNLKALEQQARRTKRYFALKENYKQLSIKLAAIKTAILKERYKEIKSQLQKEEDAYRQFEVEQNKLEAQLEAQRKANLDQEQALSAQQREVNNLSGAIRDKENERKMLEHRVNFAEQNKVKSNEQISISKARMSTLETEIGDFASRLAGEKKLEAELEARLTEAEGKLNAIRQNHGTLKTDLDAIMQNQQQVERALFELEKQKAVNKNEVDTLRQDMERGAADVQSKEAEAGLLKSNIAGLEKEEKARQEQLAKLELAEEQRLERIEKTEEELDVLNNDVLKIRRELDAKRNEYKLTKSMVENLEGFPESIRFLSNAKNWTKNATLLSDLIYVEKDYRVAIENYLEPYLNYYVVQNLEEAAAAVQLLHSAQKGKANFFLLDSFANYTPPIAMLPPASQNAFDLIKCEPEYRNLINYLLENVIVTGSEEVAKQLPGDNLTLLAKSGRFIQRRNSLSGGSIGLFEGKKIGRKKNLEILEKAIAKSEQQENKLSTRMYDMKASLDDLKSRLTRNEIHRTQNELNKVVQERVSLSARLESFENFIKETSSKKERTKERIHELSSQNESIEKQLEDSSKMAERARQTIANTDVSFRQVAEQLSQASTDYNNQNIEFIRQQNKAGALQRELSFRENQLEETKEALAASEKLLAQSYAEVAQINLDREKLEGELVAAYQLRKETEGALSNVEKAFFQARGGINEIEDSLRQLSKKSHEAQLLINNLKEKFNDIKFQLSSVAERIRIEFNLSINDTESLAISPEEREQTDETELQIKVERMRGRLDNYGEINPLAVEAYDEMKGRFDTISSQREDILKAKDDLMETIREIEETATTQFLDSFGKVRLYFIDVFRSLFTEDDAADLILLDAENPLESSIEIVAKPKGKRPLTISQLSGGEKTLTATALLFALYLLKPAPFCIFDEVDAPLDDANIVKFNRIIKDFSKDSQFLIVTHNKQTMATVDTIYGVYMFEQGVSALAQVDFRDLQHDVVFENMAG